MWYGCLDVSAERLAREGKVKTEVKVETESEMMKASSLLNLDLNLSLLQMLQLGRGFHGN